jgi:hypothetical protein
MPVNWGVVRDGETFEALVHTLLYAREPEVILFGLPGRDSGQDARSADGRTVWQAKHKNGGMNTAQAIRLALHELKQIRRYRESSHPNHAHWSQVDRWILVANVQKNPNRAAEWRSRVVPPFAKVGIKAQCLGLEHLNQWLVHEPDIREAFFEGRNRVLLTLTEARRLLAQSPEADTGFGAPLLGRGAELARVLAFAESPEAQVLPIVGKGGTGKTRFMFEALLALQERGFRVHWAAMESMQRSDQWFRSAGPTAHTAAAIDEPTDAALVRTLLEQMATEGATRLKVLIACRAAKGGVLQELTSLRRNVIDTPIQLGPLALEDAKAMLLAMLSTKLDDARLHGLAEHLGRCPVWLAIAAMLLNRDGHFRRLPAKVDDLGMRYVAEAIADLPEALRGKAYGLLRWVCLFGTFPADAEGLWEFLAGRGITRADALGILGGLASRGLLRNWGLAKRLYAVDPDVVREQVLAAWLFDPLDAGYRVGTEGREVVRLWLGGGIPEPERVIQNLSRLECAYLEDGTEPLLAPVFEELKRLVVEGSVAEQQQVLGLMQRIGASDVTRATDILRLIADHPKPDATTGTPASFGLACSHESVVAGRGQALFSLARHVGSFQDAHSLTRELCRQFLWEATHACKPQRGQDAKALLDQLIRMTPNSAVFAEPAADRAVGLLDRAAAQGSLPSAEMDLMQVLAASLTNVERETHEMVGWALQFTFACLVPGEHAEWRALTQVRTRLRSVLASGSLGAEIGPLMWRLYAESHHQFGRMILRERVKDGLADRYRGILADDLAWCEEALAGRMLRLGEITAARRVWSWYLDYGKDAALRALAQRCEEHYCRHPGIARWRMDLLQRTTDNDEAIRDAGSRVAQILMANESPEAYLDFLADAEEMVSAGAGSFPDWCIRDVVAEVARGKPLGPGWMERDALGEALRRLLSEVDVPAGRPVAWSVAGTVSEMLLGAVRRKCPDRFSQEWAALVGVTAAKVHLLCWLYSDPCPTRSGQFLDADVSGVFQYRDLFIPDELPRYFRILGMLYLPFRQSIAIEVESLSRVYGKQDTHGLHNVFADALCRYVLRRADPPPTVEDITWLLDVFAPMPDAGDLLTSSHLEHIVDRMGSKLPLKALARFLANRIAAEKAYDGHGSPSFLGHDFDPSKLFAWDLQRSADREAFQRILAMSGDGESWLAQREATRITARVDPEGTALREFIDGAVGGLQENCPLGEIEELASVVGQFQDDTDTWARLALPVLKLLRDRPVEERHAVYRSLAGNHERGGFWGPDGMPPLVLKREEKSMNLYNRDIGTPYEEYRKLAWDNAKHEVERLRGWAEERR